MIKEFFGKIAGSGTGLPSTTIRDKLKAEIAVSQTMLNAIALWNDMYMDNPFWKGEKGLKTQTMNLPSAICKEFSRLITQEWKFEVTGSPRAVYINKQMQTSLQRFPSQVEKYCAKGGIAIKPYISGGNVILSFYTADRFYPTAYDTNDDISGAVFIEQMRKGDYVLTRLEFHEMTYNAGTEGGTGNIYRVRNKAYRSERLTAAYTGDDDFDLYNCRNPLLEEISLESVEEWSDLEPETVSYDLERPLFVYVKTPDANCIDSNSPLGISVFARAIEAIREADRQYTRCINEFDMKEVAIHAPQDFFRTDREGNPILPSGRERLYRVIDDTSENQKIVDFSPDIRDSSFFNGLNKQLQQVEFLVGLSRGTLSDVNETDKTATEVKMSKQRAYSTVNALQSEWDDALKKITDVVNVLASAYSLAPEGTYETSIAWGDGVLEDADAEYARRYQMVMSGLLRPSAFIAWYFGCSEEEAIKKYMPPQEPTMDEAMFGGGKKNPDDDSGGGARDEPQDEE